MFWRNKSTSHSQDGPIDARLQKQYTDKQHRVRAYYTASRHQIRAFENQNSDRHSRHKHRVLLHRSIVIACCALCAVALYGMFSLNGGVNVVVRDDNGSTLPYRSIDTYNSLISTIMHADIRNNIKPLLQTQNVQNAIKETLPETTEVSVYAPLIGREAEVIITTPAPFAVLLQSSGDSYIINARGKVTIPYEDSALDTDKLPTIMNESGIVYESGSQLFRPDEMTTLHDIYYQYTKGKEDRTVPFILPESPREIYVQEGSYIAKFSIGTDVSAAHQYGSLKAVQGRLLASGNIPKEYVDVRLGYKVFVK